MKIVKIIVEIILIFIVATIINFNVKIKIANQKMEEFYKNIEESSISYVVEDGVYLVFNYDYIYALANSIFEGYKIEINKENECAFNITVVVEESFLNKKINEIIYIGKGEMYD